MEKSMETTLCYLISGDKILLGEKKRGFAVGILNGVGGKLEENETAEEALIRETQEEISVTPTEFEKRAVIWFDSFYKGEKVNYPCHVYLVTKWLGEPKETDEIKPFWFDKNKLPFDKMFSDDKLWLERVLAGEKLQAHFKFDKEDNLISYDIKKV